MDGQKGHGTSFRKPLLTFEHVSDQGGTIAGATTAVHKRGSQDAVIVPANAGAIRVPLDAISNGTGATVWNDATCILASNATGTNASIDAAATR